tara:strand:- start:45 stop:419 length:375 start_codon:yes stop_codon:yes gene_type:complete
METFTIKVSGKDLQMLRRIAKAENRRFSDFVQLCFAGGLDYMFCDEMLYVEKESEDYTQEEQKQLDLNAELDKIPHKNFAEKEAAGYKYVGRCFCNHVHDSETNTHRDEIIEPMVKRIREVALN